MLEEAILAAKAENAGLKPVVDAGSPTISVDAAVSIPEDYVPDLGLRMALYRRAADLEGRGAIEAFAAELIDRFGPLPPPAANLLKIVEAKSAAKKAGIAKLEVGPKGALATFGSEGPPSVAGVLAWIERLKGAARLRPDGKLFLAREFPNSGARLAGAVAVARGLAQAADGPPKAEPKAQLTPEKGVPVKPRGFAPAPFRAKR
jgi:transcription-repair coupling factor (superfamily II helicase)